MTEPGADQRARGAMEDDARIVIAPISHSVPAYGRVACTRAELWAAIERLAAASYDLGVDDGMDETETINSIESADAWLALRALLGMEPE